MTLGRKQSLPDQEAWESAWEHAHLLWPDDRLDRLVDRTIDRIDRDLAGRSVTFGWSGGKDSIALEIVMRAAGHDDCFLVISALEHPLFLRWATDWMPDQLTVVERDGIDLDWLKAHPNMLFPQGPNGPRWFKAVQHAGQREYVRATGVDVLAVGRRWADGNYTGAGRGDREYTNREGITRYSPLADWPHEAVLALIKRSGITMPPCYSWPRGFQVGTGSWPARQFTRTQRQGWAETYEIDDTVVRLAADHDLPGARRFLDTIGD